jgi:hypothetical protein
MDFIEKLEKVIESGILSDGLSDIPSKGATDIQISMAEENLGRKLSTQHKRLLERWNGANFDFIRVLGIAPLESEFLEDLIKENKEWKEVVDEIGDNALYFANDVSGFMYFELGDGSIVQLDTDGGTIEKVADDMEDFFNNYLFGERGEEYMSGWLDELKEYGVIS